MILFFGFCLFLLTGVCSLVIWPIMMHPTLPQKRKWQFSIIAFVLLVPLGIALYWWLGVPQIAGIS